MVIGAAGAVGAPVPWGDGGSRSRLCSGSQFWWSFWWGLEGDHAPQSRPSLSGVKFGMPLGADPCVGGMQIVVGDDGAVGAKPM
jgi:hypothetical protein